MNARRAAERLVDERLVMGVILFNLVILFARALPSMARYETSLFWIDYACLVYFFAEMTIKIRLTGWVSFWARSINRFDLILVLASAPTLVSAFADIEELSLVLVFRTGRLLRFLRVLRFIPYADQLWSGIGRALKASVGLLLALTLYNMVLALIGCHLFAEVAPAHFGDPFTGVYTLFKVFTIEGWYDIPSQIAAVDPALGLTAKVFFSFAVITGGILGLGIANAVFVDEMVLDNNAELQVEIEGLRGEVDGLRTENAAILASISAKLDALNEKDSLR